MLLSRHGRVKSHKNNKPLKKRLASMFCIGVMSLGLFMPIVNDFWLSSTVLADEDASDTSVTGKDLTGGDANKGNVYDGIYDSSTQNKLNSATGYNERMQALITYSILADGTNSGVSGKSLYASLYGKAGAKDITSKGNTPTLTALSALQINYNTILSQMDSDKCKTGEQSQNEEQQANAKKTDEAEKNADKHDNMCDTIASSGGAKNSTRYQYSDKFRQAVCDEALSDAKYYVPTIRAAYGKTEQGGGLTSSYQDVYYKASDGSKYPNNWDYNKTVSTFGLKGKVSGASVAIARGYTYDHSLQELKNEDEEATSANIGSSMGADSDKAKKSASIKDIKPDPATDSGIGDLEKAIGATLYLSFFNKFASQVTAQDKSASSINAKTLASDFTLYTDTNVNNTAGNGKDNFNSVINNFIFVEHHYKGIDLKVYTGAKKIGLAGWLDNGVTNALSSGKYTSVTDKGRYMTAEATKGAKSKSDMLGAMILTSDTSKTGMASEVRRSLNKVTGVAQNKINTKKLKSMVGQARSTAKKVQTASKTDVTLIAWTPIGAIQKSSGNNSNYQEDQSKSDQDNSEQTENLRPYYARDLWSSDGITSDSNSSYSIGMSNQTDADNVSGGTKLSKFIKGTPNNYGELYTSNIVKKGGISGYKLPNNDNVLGIDNYGDIIVGTSGTVVIPYWENTTIKEFKSFASSDGSMAVSPFLNSSKQDFIKSLGNKSFKSLESSISDKQIQNTLDALGSTESPQDVRSDLSSFVSSNGKLDTGKLASAMSKSGNAQLLSDLTAVIVGLTHSQVSDYNKSKFAKSASSASRLYLKLGDVGLTAKNGSSNDTSADGYSATALGHLIWKILNTGGYSFLRKTVAQGIMRLYASSITSASGASIFYTGTIADDQNFKDVVISLLPLATALLGVLLLWLTFLAFRKGLRWTEILRRLVIFALLILAILSYGKVTNFMMNDLGSGLLGRQLRQTFVLDNWSMKQANTKASNDFAKAFYGVTDSKNNDMLRDRQQDYLVYFYTTTTKSGQDIYNPSTTSQGGLNAVNRAKSYLFQQGLDNNAYTENDLQRVGVSAFDLNNWSIEMFNAMQSHHDKLEDFIGNTNDGYMSLFQWLLTESPNKAYYNGQTNANSSGGVADNSSSASSGSSSSNNDNPAPNKNSADGDKSIAGKREYYVNTNKLFTPQAKANGFQNTTTGFNQLTASDLYLMLYYNNRILHYQNLVNVKKALESKSTQDGASISNEAREQFINDLSSTIAVRKDDYYGANGNIEQKTNNLNSNELQYVHQGNPFSDSTYKLFAVSGWGTEADDEPASDFFGLDDLIKRVHPYRDYGESTLTEDVYNVNHKLLEDYFNVYSQVRTAQGLIDSGGVTNNTNTLTSNSSSKNTSGNNSNNSDKCSVKTADGDKVDNSTSDFDDAERASMTLDALFTMDKQFKLHLFPTEYQPKTISFDTNMRSIYVPMADYKPDNPYEQNTAEYLASREDLVSLIAFGVALIALMLFGVLYFVIFSLPFLVVIVFLVIWTKLIKPAGNNDLLVGITVIYVVFAIAKLGLFALFDAMNAILNYSYNSFGGRVAPFTLLYSLVIIAYIFWVFKYFFIPMWRRIRSDGSGLGGSLFRDDIHNGRDRLRGLAKGTGHDLFNGTMGGIKIPAKAGLGMTRFAGRTVRGVHNGIKGSHLGAWAKDHLPNLGSETVRKHLGHLGGSELRQLLNKARNGSGWMKHRTVKGMKRLISTLPPAVAVAMKSRLQQFAKGKATSNGLDDAKQEQLVKDGVISTPVDANSIQAVDFEDSALRDQVADHLAHKGIESIKHGKSGLNILWNGLDYNSPAVKQEYLGHILGDVVTQEIPKSNAFMYRSKKIKDALPIDTVASNLDKGDLSVYTGGTQGLSAEALRTFVDTPRFRRYFDTLDLPTADTIDHLVDNKGQQASIPLHLKHGVNADKAMQALKAMDAGYRKDNKLKPRLVKTPMVAMPLAFGGAKNMDLLRKSIPNLDGMINDFSDGYVSNGNLYYRDTDANQQRASELRKTVASRLNALNDQRSNKAKGLLAYITGTKDNEGYISKVPDIRELYDQASQNPNISPDVVDRLRQIKDGGANHRVFNIGSRPAQQAMVKKSLQGLFAMNKMDLDNKGISAYHNVQNELAQAGKDYLTDNSVAGCQANLKHLGDTIKRLGLSDQCGDALEKIDKLTSEKSFLEYPNKDAQLKAVQEGIGSVIGSVDHAGVGDAVLGRVFDANSDPKADKGMQVLDKLRGIRKGLKDVDPSGHALDLANSLDAKDILLLDRVSDKVDLNANSNSKILGVDNLSDSEAKGLKDLIAKINEDKK